MTSSHLVFTLPFDLSPQLFYFDLELTLNLKEAEQGTQHIIAIIHDLIFQKFIK